MTALNHADSELTVPGLGLDQAREVREVLQDRLIALSDLVLTLKHIHWNVVGPNFIGVHEMLDTQYQGVSRMVDEVAERMATVGGQPCALPGFVAANRRWDDYSVGRAQVPEHLEALDQVYDGVNGDQRSCIARLECDPVSQDLLIDHAKELEQYQWFVRAHLEDESGRLTGGPRARSGSR